MKKNKSNKSISTTSPSPAPSRVNYILFSIIGLVIGLTAQPLILTLYKSYFPETHNIVNQPSTVVTTPAPTLTNTVMAEMEQSTETLITSTTSATTTTTTTTETVLKERTANNKIDLTVDEEAIVLKNESIEITPSTTKPTSTTTKAPKKEKILLDKKQKPKEQPQLIDVTGRHTEIPDEVKNFKSTKINPIKTKKLWIPIPNSNGGHRRVPPVSIRPGKEHNSSIKHWLFDEFLSQDECRSLIKVHKQHVEQMKKIDPIICFDSVQTLRKYVNDLRPDDEISVTPNDFTKGTMCVNATFSSTLKHWGLKWSYSTAFYPGESAFSNILTKRIEDGTALQATHGGKFQITSTDEGIGYKTHRDCTLNGLKQDRYATVLIYLNTVTKGGETEFPDLGIKVSPKEGRALVWNNMNDDGECETLSEHSANIVEDKQGKFVLQRWYYYENFYSLGKRPPEPEEPERQAGQVRVSCDEYDRGSCRAYDEWNYDHLIKYRNIHHNLS